MGMALARRCVSMSGFDSAQIGIKAGNWSAALLGLLGQLGADALKSIANRGVGRRHVLVAMIDFKAAVVCVRLDQLVHSRTDVVNLAVINAAPGRLDDKST